MAFYQPTLEYILVNVLGSLSYAGFKKSLALIRDIDNIPAVGLELGLQFKSVVLTKVPGPHHVNS
ncbi:hypothetical protein [Allomuricauda sp. ARW1Y1]|uniref:hypothetical protein n=1 Tax=Allomuricauda sp. ARW1Y1 TaxID=2663843 RepID=UPI0015CD12B5|nr:hypothetical protein [Muricauda sp. ARW1Y1]NYJ27538.1 hypothetical protein [Muricauda sp. ARW1Y1]